MLRFERTLAVAHRDGGKEHHMYYTHLPNIKLLEFVAYVEHRPRESGT